MAESNIKKFFSQQGEPNLKTSSKKGGDNGDKLLKVVVVFFIFSILVALGVGLYFISGFANSSRDVTLDINGIDKVYRGSVFDLSINITNRTETLLQNSSLSVNLPAGIIGLNTVNGRELMSEDIGDVGGGSLAKKSYKFLAVGENNSKQNILIKLTYFVGGSRFEVSKTKQIGIDKSAIEVEFKKPDQILNGSTFTFDINYKNISDFDFPDVILEAKYPIGFKFNSSSLPPDSLNNRWRLGEFKAGSRGTLQIKSTLDGFGGTQLDVPIKFLASFLGRDYVITEQNVNFSVSPSPIVLEILLNRQSDYVARIGDQLIYTIRYTNNSGIVLADVVINANLAGELFDFSTLETDGRLEPVGQNLSWDSSSQPNLRLLDPGSSGEINLKIRLKNEFPIRRLNDKNFYLRINSEITSPSVPYYLSAEKTKAAASLETKVAGLISIDARAYYRDAPSGIVNNGTMPPRANQPTEYTVHWLIKNYSTDVHGVEVKAVLQPSVEWTGLVKSNIDSVPLYNDVTKEVVWNISKIIATKGITGDPLEAIFQIRATPNMAELGQYQPLLGETKLQATDDFTALDLINSDLPLSTLLPDDKTIGQGGGRVLP